MKKILIVDDQQEILTLLSKLMTQLGHDSATADNWQDANRLFDEADYDLVMLDVHMPGRNGFEVAKAFRIQKPEQKIVIMTGLDPGTVHQTLKEIEVDFNEMLYKPFRIPQIQSILHRVFG